MQPSHRIRDGEVDGQRVRSDFGLESDQLLSREDEPQCADGKLFGATELGRTQQRRSTRQEGHRLASVCDQRYG